MYIYVYRICIGYTNTHYFENTGSHKKNRRLQFKKKIVFFSIQRHRQTTCYILAAYWRYFLIASCIVIIIIASCIVLIVPCSAISAVLWFEFSKFQLPLHPFKIRIKVEVTRTKRRTRRTRKRGTGPRTLSIISSGGCGQVSWLMLLQFRSLNHTHHKNVKSEEQVLFGWFGLTR